MHLGMPISHGMKNLFRLGCDGASLEQHAPTAQDKGISSRSIYTTVNKIDGEPPVGGQEKEAECLPWVAWLQRFTPVSQVVDIGH